MPLAPKELIRAKAFTSLILSLAGALALSIVAAVFFEPTVAFLFKVLATSVLTSIQSVFMGLNFATRYSDFAERPRPRYITPGGMLKAMLAGIAAVVITSLPVLLFFESQPYLSFMLSVVLFSSITAAAYRYSLKGAQSLTMEMKN